MKKNYTGQITILSSRDGVKIEIEDAKSSVTFATIHLTPEQFSAAVGRQGGVPCVLETRGLNLVGKNLVIKKDTWIECKRPDIAPYSSVDREHFQNYLNDLYQDTIWKPTHCLSSQNSTKKEEGKLYVRCTLRAYVDDDQVDQYRNDPDYYVADHDLSYWDR